jgi:5-methylcytosine-specific restriction protein B
VEPKAPQVAPPVADARNVIFYGPPGTGKTYRLRGLLTSYGGKPAEAGGGPVTNPNDPTDRYEFVTFHQSYCHENSMARCSVMQLAHILGIPPFHP